MTDEEKAKLKQHIQNWKETSKIMEKLRLEETQESFDVLTGLNGMWVAREMEKDICCWLRFETNGTGEFCYKSNKSTLSFKIRFELEAKNIIKICYLETPFKSSVKNFTPNRDDQFKEFFFLLSEETSQFNDTLTARLKVYQRKLRLENSIFPEEIEFPYKVPLEFYGDIFTNN